MIMITIETACLCRHGKELVSLHMKHAQILLNKTWKIQNTHVVDHPNTLWVRGVWLTLPGYEYQVPGTVTVSYKIPGISWKNLDVVRGQRIKKVTSLCDSHQQAVPSPSHHSSSECLRTYIRVRTS
ncbi:unnamed protein product, partial [Laminaria digitata]